MMKSPINTVTNKKITTLDIASWIPGEESICIIDLKKYLYKEFVLKEEEFKSAIESSDWSFMKDKLVMIYCSNSAIIPTWAYMLLCQYITPYSKFCAYAPSMDVFINLVLLEHLNKLDVTAYTDQRLIIKGCGDKRINENIYMTLTSKLLPVARSIAYGEPCSMVPLYRKKID